MTEAAPAPSRPAAALEEVAPGRARLGGLRVRAAAGDTDFSYLRRTLGLTGAAFGRDLEDPVHAVLAPSWLNR